MAEYQTLCNIQVQQIPTDKYPNRDYLLNFSFLHSYEGTTTWEWLTDKFTLVLPKKVRVKATRSGHDPFSFAPTTETFYVQLGNIDGQNANIGGFDQSPAFLRGDLIKFNVGYSGIVSGGTQTYMTGTNGIPNRFEGVISGVFPKLPFTLECEDYMWLLKQMPTPAQHWPANTKLQDVATQTLENSKTLPVITRYNGYVNLTVSDFSQTDLNFNVGNLQTTRGSLATFLARIKSEYRVDSYFRGQQLRIGYLHYVPGDQNLNLPLLGGKYPVFTFQKNIIEDKLKWQRKDDAVLSMIVKSNYQKEGKGTTQDGQQKMVHACTEILIYNDSGVFRYVTKKVGGEFPTHYLKDIGERFTMNIFDAITDPVALRNIGVAQLKKYYYDGFKGSFLTFGIPYIQHGDTIQIVNNQLPEQSGYYKVKAVNFTGGFDIGRRHEIFIDYKVSE